MSLQRGQIAYALFAVAGEQLGLDMPGLPPGGQFREIDPTSDVETAAGWCDFHNPMSFDYADSTGEWQAIRIDTLTIPSATLTACVEVAAKERCAQLGRDKLAKREMDVLKFEIKKGLRKRSLPKTKHVQIYIGGEGEVRIFAGGAALSRAVDMLEKRSGLQLRPAGLLSILWLRGMAESEIDALGSLEPARFHLIRQ